MIFQLTEREFNLIHQVFQKFPEIREVKIYGSRALGNAKHNSDIDFAILGDIDFKKQAKIAYELDELPLPYFFDVTVYDKIDHEDLKQHIDRYGKVFYQKPRIRMS